MLAKFPRPKVPLLLAVAAAAGGSAVRRDRRQRCRLPADHGGFLQPGNLLVSGSVYASSTPAC